MSLFVRLFTGLLNRKHFYHASVIGLAAKSTVYSITRPKCVAAGWYEFQLSCHFISKTPWLSLENLMPAKSLLARNIKRQLKNHSLHFIVEMLMTALLSSRLMVLIPVETKTSKSWIRYFIRGSCRLLSYMGVLFVCPLMGAWLSNKPLGPYLEFPPIPEKNQAPVFSWGMFYLIATLSIMILIPFLSRIMLSNNRQFPEKPVKNHFPFWGWLGMILMMLAWLVAWNRFEWLGALQEFTFMPLWLSFILVINAMTYRRIGRCLLIDHTRYYLVLFLISACFWWSFEYLNRFVQNWFYVGITDFGPVRYFIYNTLPFSTVLPAVLGTAKCLNTFPGISADLNRFKPFHPIGAKTMATICLVSAPIGFIALSIWPKALYSLIWLLPILLVTGLHSLTEKPRLVLDIETGDWRRIWTLAVSGLICGLFWEMWNVNSLAHWEYRIPYVQRFEIFEMPLLGYLGYLPFGILCGLFADFILPSSTNSR